MSKPVLLGLLYLCQTAPKGYLAFLPILLRHQKASLKQIAALSLCTLPELLKPLFALLLDQPALRSVHHKQKVIIGLELVLIACYTRFAFIDSPSLTSLTVIFAMTSLVVAVHDTAVDGLAVQLLAPADHAMGGFGQYFGYKLGSLLTGGVLPALLGDSHRTFCLAIVLVMSSVTLLVSSTKLDSMSLTSYDDRKESRRTGSVSLQQLLRRYGLLLPVCLLTYKLFEHALDYLWTSILVDLHIDRKVIVQTQLLYGSLAALLGAWAGQQITSSLQRRGVNAMGAVALCGVGRLLAEGLQVMFVYCTQHAAHAQGWGSFLTLHALLENACGSALTSAMFSALLALSDLLMPALSYAYLNTIVLLGMQMGRYLTSFAAEGSYLTFCAACWVMNLLFVLLAGYLSVGLKAKV